MRDKYHLSKLPLELQQDAALLDWLREKWYDGVRYGLNSFGDEDWLSLEESFEPTEEDWQWLRRLRFVRHLSINSPALISEAIERLSVGSHFEGIHLADVDLTVSLAQLLKTHSNLRALSIRPTGPINGDKPGAEVHPDAIRILISSVPLDSLSLERSLFHPAGLLALADCEAIRNLSLDGASIDDDALKIIGSMKSLVSLNLRGTAITGGGIGGLSGMPLLAELRLDDTWLDERAVEPLGSLPSLVDLNLRESHVAESGLVGLGRLPRIRELNLGSLPVSDRIAELIGTRGSLERLWLERTDITDDGVASLAGLANLRSLGLNGTRITDRAFGSIAKLSRLESLGVSDTRVSDRGLLQLTGLARLEWLEFQNTLAKGACFDQLRSMPAIKQLIHSELPLLKRSRNFLRYGDVDYIIDRRRTTLNACIDIRPTETLTKWWIEISCKQTGVPSGLQPARLSDFDLDARVDDWRNFEDQHFERRAKGGEEPVANIYTGIHDSVSRFNFRFGKRKGLSFRVRGRGVAEGGAFKLHGRMRLGRVIVRDYVEDRGDVERARRLVRRMFPTVVVGEPEVWQGWVTFRFVAEA